jgi:hypothetical protein
VCGDEDLFPLRERRGLHVLPGVVQRAHLSLKLPPPPQHCLALADARLLYVNNLI